MWPVIGRRGMFVLPAETPWIQIDGTTALPTAACIHCTSPTTASAHCQGNWPSCHSHLSVPWAVMI